MTIEHVFRFLVLTLNWDGTPDTAMRRFFHYFFDNFEQSYVLATLLSVAAINYAIPQKLAFLNFYYLPVILAGYYLGKRRSVLGALLSIMLVTVYVLISPDLFLARGTRLDLIIHMVVWACFLLLAGAVVGTLQERLKERHRAVNDAYAQLDEHSRNLESTVRDRTRTLEDEVARRRTSDKALKKANEKLKRLAVVDRLTQIANRRRFDRHLKTEWRRMRREQRPLCLILCDIDHFKAYNDTYGHQAGDDCLRRVAQCINAQAKRPGDLTARYGGEEFGVILPNTEPAGAVHVANVIRRAVAALGIEHRSNTAGDRVTVSLGVAAAVPGSNEGWDILVAEADQTLYAAKARGRNTVVHAEG